MAELTVVITVKNDFESLTNTLKSIRTTQDTDVDILVIQDASTDQEDYVGVCTKYDSRIIINPINLGIAPSRDLGARESTTPYLMFIDAHMRFRRDNWTTKVLATLKKYPRTILGVGCGILTEARLKELHTQDLLDAKMAEGGCAGCSVKLGKVPDVGWLPIGTMATVKDPHPQVPALMGACYSISRVWYNHIGGLSYLTKWGFDEELLSLKSWRLGGDCRLLTDVWVGHIWGTQSQSYDQFFHNRNMYITILLALPPEYREPMLNELRDSGQLTAILQNLNVPLSEVLRVQSQLDLKSGSLECFERVLKLTDSILKSTEPTLLKSSDGDIFGARDFVVTGPISIPLLMSFVDLLGDHSLWLVDCPTKIYKHPRSVKFVKTLSEIPDSLTLIPVNPSSILKPEVGLKGTSDSEITANILQTNEPTVLFINPKDSKARILTNNLMKELT